MVTRGAGHNGDSTAAVPSTPWNSPLPPVVVWIKGERAGRVLGPTRVVVEQVPRRQAVCCLPRGQTGPDTVTNTQRDGDSWSQVPGCRFPIRGWASRMPRVWAKPHEAAACISVRIWSEPSAAHEHTLCWADPGSAF